MKYDSLTLCKLQINQKKRCSFELSIKKNNSEEKINHVFHQNINQLQLFLY